MARLADKILKIRSKNAGPFWLTIDIFCGSPATYAQITKALSTHTVARLLQIEPQTIKRYDIEPLATIKLSLPRPTIQGAIDDRDIHGASWAHLLGDLNI